MAWGRMIRVQVLRVAKFRAIADLPLAPGHTLNAGPIDLGRVRAVMQPESKDAGRQCRQRDPDEGQAVERKNSWIRSGVSRMNSTYALAAMATGRMPDNRATARTTPPISAIVKPPIVATT